MRQNKFIFLLLFVLFSISMLHAQTGVYDVRFAIPDSSIVAFCNTQQLYIDIEIKASSTAREFGIGEQNYRFSFNKKALANPTIIEELDLKSGTPLPSPGGVSFYSAHNLNGSLDSVVSYNVEHLFGEGVLAISDDWLPVGRVGFDVIDPFACYDLMWHDSLTFPSTFVGELVGLSRFDANEGSFTNNSECYNTLCLMPVELLSFTGEASNCNVNLLWSTATEDNSSHFIVERSEDGVHFQDIGRVGAAGDSQSLLNYEFTDTQFESYSYYRLKQVDIGGRYAYTDIVRVISTCFEPDDVIDVFPNPVSYQDLSIKLQSSVTASARIMVTDINGRVISETPVQITEGSNMLQVSTDNLSSGTYFVQVKGEMWNSQVQKIVKLADE